MRAVRLAKTFEHQLIELLDHGEQRFGVAVVNAVKQRVETTIRSFLAAHPAAKTRDPRLGLTCYPIARTPFVVVYDFDDDELRVYFIFHRHADLEAIDPASAKW